MKKRRFLSVLLTIVLLLHLLTACQALLNNDPTSASTPSSNSVALPPPIYSTTAPPPTTSAPPATEPTTPPSVKYEGYSFIYDGEQPFISMTLDLSNCTYGHLYWVDEGNTTVIPIIEEEIAPCYNEYWEKIHGHVYWNEDGVVYFVKTAEPTKIYRTCREDFTKHELFYESSHGSVVDLGIYDVLGNYLQFVADNKKFIVLNMKTMEETVMMEMFYIFSAFMDSGNDNELDDMIFWSGKPTEEDRHFTYGYSCVTGEIWEEPS